MTAPAFVLGVDFGSTAGKAVVLDGTGEIRGAAVSAKGAVSDLGVREAMAEALTQAGITEREVARAVSKNPYGTQHGRFGTSCRVARRRD